MYHSIKGCGQDSLCKWNVGIVSNLVRHACSCCSDFVCSVLCLITLTRCPLISAATRTRALSLVVLCSARQILPARLMLSVLCSQLPMSCVPHGVHAFAHPYVNVRCLRSSLYSAVKRTTQLVLSSKSMLGLGGIGTLTGLTCTRRTISRTLLALSMSMAG